MYNVLFDLGNVLIDFDHRIVSQRLAEYVPENRRSSTIQNELHGFIFGNGEPNSPNVELDRGSKDLDELHNEISQHFDIAISSSDFGAIWQSIFSDELNADAVACWNQLSESGLTVSICSNTNPGHWIPLLDSHAELRDLTEINTCFLSYEMGKQKADPGFFELIANATNAPREHHVLIDDLKENCASAESAGMHAVLFQPKDPNESIHRINEFVKTHGWGRTAPSQSK